MYSRSSAVSNSIGHSSMRDFVAAEIFPRSAPPSPSPSISDEPSRLEETDEKVFDRNRALRWSGLLNFIFIISFSVLTWQLASKMNDVDSKTKETQRLEQSNRKNSKQMEACEAKLQEETLNRDESKKRWNSQLRALVTQKEAIEKQNEALKTQNEAGNEALKKKLSEFTQLEDDIRKTKEELAMKNDEVRQHQAETERLREQQAETESLRERIHEMECGAERDRVQVLLHRVGSSCGSMGSTNIAENPTREPSPMSPELIQHPAPVRQFVVFHDVENMAAAWEAATFLGSQVPGSSSTIYRVTSDSDVSVNFENIHMHAATENLRQATEDQ